LKKEEIMKGKGIFQMRIFAITLALFIGVIGFASTGAAAEKYTLTYLTPWSKATKDVADFIKFVDQIQKEADKKYPGELALVYKGGPEVIPPLEQVDACRKGVVNMLWAVPSYYGSVMPEMDLLALTEVTPWKERTTGLFEYLEKLHNQKTNTHFLARGTGSYFYSFTTKPVKAVDDFKGMKLRVSPTNIPFVKALGAVPVQMPPSDVYTAMERGLVTGYIIPTTQVQDFGLTKVTKYMILPPVYMPSTAWLVNLDAWRKLPKHLQEFLSEKGQAWEHHYWDRNQALYVEDVNTFKKAGIEVLQLAPPEAAKLKKIARGALIGAIKPKVPDETEKILEYLAKTK
jgi:TRAP-type C4-dicarboxylate transport system substrate-binding protein